MYHNELYTEEHTGAFILLESLVRNGTTSLFGYPGGAVLPIYDELYSWEKCNLIQHFLVRHEQGAVHAADGYARSTGKVGVCFATSGPGATNLVTGIATAYMDSIPLIVVTGQVPCTLLGTDAFQEIDIFGITLSIVKHSYLIKNPTKLLFAITEAFYIAQNGRPGPVLIDFPKNIGLEIVEDYYIIHQKHVAKILGYRYQYKGTLYHIIRVLDYLEVSTQPLIYAGGGVITSNATYELGLLVENYQLPITTTLMGKGSFDESHCLSLGMLGMHGTAYANFAVSNCDLLIAIGARFDDRVTGKLSEFACTAAVIHIDIDPAEQSKNRLANLTLVGDVKQILREILFHLREPIYQRKEKMVDWMIEIDRWKELYPLELPNNSLRLNPQEIIKYLGSYAPEAYFTTDVGQHQMWSAQYINCQPRKLDFKCWSWNYGLWSTCSNWYSNSFSK